MDPNLREEIIRLHAQICKALADSNRILILYTLHEGPHSVGEMTEKVHLTQPSVSRHLKILRERGMVSAHRNGQSVIYILEDERIIEALDLLRDVLADNLRSQVVLANSANEKLNN